MAARDNDFRPANAVLDRDDVGAQPIPHVVILDHDPLALRHDRFKFSEIENHVGTIEASHRAAHDLARAILEFLVDHLLLDLADALHHRLLGSLGGDPPEIFRGHFHFDRFPNGRVGLDPARLIEGDFVLRVGHRFDHEQIRERANFAGLRVDIDMQIARGTDAFLGSGKQGIGNRLDQDFAFDSALPLEVIQHGDKLSVHGN